MITAIKFSGIDLTRNLIEVCKTWTNGKTYRASGFTHKFVSSIQETAGSFSVG